MWYMHDIQIYVEIQARHAGTHSNGTLSLALDATKYAFMVQQNYACPPQLLVACGMHFYSQIVKKNESSYWKDLQKTCERLTDSCSPGIFPRIFQASKLARFGSDWPLFLGFRSMPSATANCSWLVSPPSAVPHELSICSKIGELSNIPFDSLFKYMSSNFLPIFQGLSYFMPKRLGKSRKLQRPHWGEIWVSWCLPVPAPKLHFFLGNPEISVILHQNTTCEHTVIVSQKADCQTVEYDDTLECDI